MRCAACNRPMLGPAVKFGKLNIGPKCARKAGLIQPQPRIRKPEPQQERDTSTVDWIEQVAA